MRYKRVLRGLRRVPEIPLERERIKYRLWNDSGRSPDLRPFFFAFPREQWRWVKN